MMVVILCLAYRQDAWKGLMWGAKPSNGDYGGVKHNNRGGGEGLFHAALLGIGGTRVQCRRVNLASRLLSGGSSNPRCSCLY